MASQRSRANVYVDGFNLYFRALSGTPHKWLDPLKLSRLLLPEYQVNVVRYFTAKVDARDDDPGQPQRQQLYLRALGTLYPNLTIKFGKFKTRRKRLPLAEPPVAGGRTVEVLVTEEKGSDVNLATAMIEDGLAGSYDIALVISNDSDLAEPIRVLQRYGVRVGVAVPEGVSPALHGDFSRVIRPRALAAAQFPRALSDSSGTFHRPPRWDP